MPRARAGLRLCLATCLLAPLSLAAQRITYTNTNWWFTNFSEVELSKAWSFDYDISVRESGPFDELAQVLWRGSIRRNLTPNLRVAFGYAGSDTHPYGDLPIAFRTPEHRIFEQVQLLQSVNRVQFTHRYRLEQRWQGRVAAVDGDTSVQNWVRTNRARYLVRATVPMQGKTLDPGEFYFTVGDELFMNFGANVQQNVFDQNRLQAAIGRRLTPGLRLEVGYLDQLVEKSSGRQLERNHTILTTLYTAFRFPGHKG